MTKALRHMSKPERTTAISRRLLSTSRGLGYWSAHAAQLHMINKAKVNMMKAAALSVAQEELRRD